MPVDQERIAPDEARGRLLMDIGSCRSRPHEGLAKADQALVGMDLDPEKIGKLIQLDGFDHGDFQGSRASPFMHSAASSDHDRRSGRWQMKTFGIHPDLIERAACSDIEQIGVLRRDRRPGWSAKYRLWG